MSTTSERATLLFYGLLLLLLFFGLIEVFIDGGRTFLLLELLGLLLLVLLALIAFIGYHHWGKRVLMVVFLLYLLNLILIWLVKGKLYVVLLVLAAIGFGVSVFMELPPAAASRPASQVRSVKKEEPHRMVFEPARATATPTAASTLRREVKSTKTFTPGKFVASSQSNQFHAPTCDWAKKIQKQRRVWFQDLDGAFEKGYRKHSCLK